MVSAGNEIGRATDRITGKEEGTKLIRVHLGGAYYYFSCGPDEDPATIPILQKRRGAKAEQIAVIGPHGHIRPDSVRDVPVVT